MNNIENPAGTTILDWSKTSKDYAKYRPGYPEKFFSTLCFFRIGLESQSILDLGAGTGALAIPFAKQGALVTANDLTASQIEQLEAICKEQDVNIKTIVSPAEELEFPEGSFDCISASMCWGYLNKEIMIPKIKSWLKKDGVLLISSLIWNSGDNPVALKTEEMLRKFNPGWRDENNQKHHKIVDEDLMQDFNLRTYHKFQHELPFKLESWRGRIRACKGMGACCTPEVVKEFDQELEQVLLPIANRVFTINHDITIKIYEVKQ